MFDWRCIYECVSPPVFSILRKAGASPYIQTAVAVAVSNTFYKVCTAVVLLLYICRIVSILKIILECVHTAAVSFVRSAQRSALPTTRIPARTLLDTKVNGEWTNRRL